MMRTQPLTRRSPRLRRALPFAAGLLLALPPSSAGADEFIAPEKLTTWSWSYIMDTHTLSLRVCGRFRPGERDQCAVAQLKDGPKERNVDRAMEMLRLSRDVLGIRIKAGAAGAFELTALTHELLSAPGIGEKAAKGTEIQLSGESLTRVIWIQSLTERNVVVRICGKLANPEYVGCVRHEDKTIAGVRRLRLLLLRGAVDQLEFKLGWDAAARRFTRLLEIKAPTQ